MKHTPSGAAAAARPGFRPLQVAAAVALALGAPTLHAQEVADAEVLEIVTVSASADASAAGLSKPLAGGQVARGGRVGILGTRDQMDVPFSVTAYTNQLIKDQQAQSVADVLLNDPSIRMARGFGNFQETYFVRGFLLYSDDIAFNGLYGLLPRQYIASDLFERVEVLRGASAFLTGVTPSGTGLGGTVNLLPKRAPNQPLTQVDVGLVNNKQFNATADVARRFGPDGSTGLRVVATHRQGKTAIDHEHNKEDLLQAGLDWHNADTRLSADVGYQNHRLEQTRTNVSLGAAVTAVPSAPKSTLNWAEPWSYSKEKDTFGTLRGEHDFNDQVTGWFALGARQSKEDNSLANLTVNSNDGAGSSYRFDNVRKDRIITGEVGARAKFTTGDIKHEVVGTVGTYHSRKKNGWKFDYGNQLATSLYSPTYHDRPDWTANATEGSFASPSLAGKVRLRSIALGDTMSFLGDQLLVTVGARHQALRVDDWSVQTGAQTAHYDQSRVSPMAGVVYKLQNNLSLYANYIEGLSQGGTAPTVNSTTGAAVTNAGQTLKPYVAKQKEVGLKYDLGNTIVAATLFSTDKPRAYVNSANTFVAAGKDRHQGLELTVQGEPIKHLRTLGGITFLDAKQRSTGSATTDGKRVIGVPKHQLSMALDWDTPWVEGLSLDTRVLYTGSVKANSTNTLEAPAWTRLDIGARYLLDVQGKLVTLRARIDNLADRKYWSSAGGYPDAGYLVQGAPRTFSLSASFDF